MSAFDPGYYNETELRQMSFQQVGDNVIVAKNCTIVGIENIVLGNNVRIDGNTTIVAAGKGWLTLGSHIHVGGYCFLSAGEGIELGDFCNLSQGVRIYSKSGDYSGEYLTNPTVPAQYTNVNGGVVKLERHVIVGSGSVILPKLTIGEGASVGALSLVKYSLKPWGIYAGSPARLLKKRSKNLLAFEQQLILDEQKK